MVAVRGEGEVILGVLRRVDDTVVLVHRFDDEVFGPVDARCPDQTGVPQVGQQLPV